MNRTIIWLNILILLISCSKISSKDADNILILLRENKSGFLIIKSDSLEVLNGGISPQFFKEKYGHEVFSIVDNDIVIISTENSKSIVMVIGINDFETAISNPNNLNFIKGDTLIIQKNNNFFIWSKK